MHIEAIILDLGGVVIDIDYNRTADAFRKLGVEHFDELYSKASQNTIFDRLETGELPAAEFRALISKETKVTLTDEQIDDAWNALLIGFNKERFKFIIELRKHYPVFLLSNTNEIHHKKFLEIADRDLGKDVFEKTFSKVYYSSSIGMRKPHEEIFNKVIEENNLHAEKTLFVDDSIQHIKGAFKVLLNAEHLLPGETIEDKYAGLLISA